MSILSIIGGLIEPVTNVIDQFIESPEEKAKAKLEVMSLMHKAETDEQKEITARWQADAKSGFLAKNVRPMSLIFVTFVFVIISFMDGNIAGFVLNPAYVAVYQTLLLTIYGAYFGARAIEKIKGVSK